MSRGGREDLTPISNRRVSVRELRDAGAWKVPNMSEEQLRAKVCTIAKNMKRGAAKSVDDTHGPDE